MYYFATTVIHNSCTERRRSNQKILGVKMGMQIHIEKPVFFADILSTTIVPVITNKKDREHLDAAVDYVLRNLSEQGVHAVHEDGHITLHRGKVRHALSFNCVRDMIREQLRAAHAESHLGYLDTVIGHIWRDMHRKINARNRTIDSTAHIAAIISF